MSDQLQRAKRVVLEYFDALDTASVAEIETVIDRFTTADYLWRGVHPFNEQVGSASVAATFWNPLRQAFSRLQRRPDVFMAGRNDVDEGATTWVCQMGQFLGLFDQPWLDIPPTRKMAFLRYAEFHRVEGDLIAETAFFTDVVSLMSQADQYPFPPQTGVSFVHPGPRTHDGLLYEHQDESAGIATMDLVNRMITDLGDWNELGNATGNNLMPAELLRTAWHDDMIWMGPEGIGATYTIDRYQQQHQFPFRFGVTDKIFKGHVARFAEGNYAGFFGWANLSNRPVGGFMGMPASNSADMRVVDIYRRDGDKLAENWVFIDLLHWLAMQGLDVLARMRQLLGIEELGTGSAPKDGENPGVIAKGDD